MKKIKVLLILSNPFNTKCKKLDLEKEEKIVRNAIKFSKYNNRFSLTIKRTSTIDDLRRTLLNDNFNLIQISGHSNKKGIFLENENTYPHQIPQDALAELLQSKCPPLKCVILNSCNSFIQGKKISLGIPFTISMMNEISDLSAIKFSEGFYDALGAGKEIDFAFKAGCNAVKLAGYKKFNPRIIVKSIQSILLLAANPNPVPISKIIGLGNTTIYWSTGNVNNSGRVMVKGYKEHNALFSDGQAIGEQTATWIKPNSTYKFILYSIKNLNKPLKTLIVKGKPK